MPAKRNAVATSARPKRKTAKRAPAFGVVCSSELSLRRTLLGMAPGVSKLVTLIRMPESAACNARSPKDGRIGPMKRMRLNLLALTVLFGAGWLLASPVSVRADGGGQACCCIKDKCCCGDRCWINKYGICTSCSGSILCFLGEIFN